MNITIIYPLPLSTSFFLCIIKKEKNIIANHKSGIKVQDGKWEGRKLLNGWRKNFDSAPSSMNITPLLRPSLDLPPFWTTIQLNLLLLHLLLTFHQLFLPFNHSYPGERRIVVDSCLSSGFGFQDIETSVCETDITLCNSRLEPATRTIPANRSLN